MYMDFSVCMPASVYIRGDPLLFKVSETSNIYSTVLLFLPAMLLDHPAPPLQLVAEKAILKLLPSSR